MSYRSLPSVVLAFLLSAATTLAVADDTDIYINPATPITEQPLVMFNLDYRPNLTSPAASNVADFFCNRVTPSMCTEVDELKAINGDGSLKFFDTLILSLQLVLRDVSGVKIGFMMSHNINNEKAGYKGENPRDTDKGSNGGVILMGFQSLNHSATRANLKQKLIALKRLNFKSNHPDQKFQGAEIFFEFFRYLTGQKVYNGHNGWFDFEGSGTRADGTTADPLTNMRCGHADTNISPACWDTSIEDMDLSTTLLDPVPINNPASSPPSYVSPLIGIGGCAKIFTINFLFQVTQNDANSNADIFLPGGTKANGGINLAVPSGGTDPDMNGVVRFLRDADLADGTWGSVPDLAGKQNVTSYFVVEPTKVNTKTITYAKSGGTDTPLELAEDPEELVNTLNNIFKQILSVSTTFVAASVPVNVFNRSEIVDNVYFALFQAEERARWKGNLKKLKLATEDVVDSETGEVVDKRFRIVDNLPAPQDAIGADGRIRFDALTHWTDNSGVLLDAGDSNGDGIVDAKDTNSDGIADNVDSTTGQVTFPTPSTGTAANPKDYITDRDGRHIPRGGAGQKIPGFRSGGAPGDSNPSGAPPDAGPRKVFYLSSSSSSASLQALNVTATPSAELKTQLGNASMTDADAQKLLRYARGQDAGDEDVDCAETDTSPTSTCRTEARYWMLGDPLHSRPLPINYGASTTTSVPNSLGHQNKKNPAIFIAMASNDGHLRMFRNTGGTTADTDPIPERGQEVWSFIPPEGLAVQKRLLDNSIPAGESPHPYSFDGEATALIIDQNGNGIIESNADENLSDRVILYIGLRRGGSAYYALDVTDPLNPKFLWRIRPGFRTTATGEAATTDFNELGQTFSRPRIARLSLGVVDDGNPATVDPARIRLAVLFGGGYDGGYALSGGDTIRLGKDIDGAMADDTKGKAIYAVRANDASLIWKAVGGTGTNTSTTFFHSGLKDSIPSNLTIVDSNADGAHDRIYVGDTGGTLWRVDMVDKDSGNATNPNQGQITDDWKLTRLACIGRHSAGAAAGGCTTALGRINDRRFFHEPDVIQSSDEAGRFDAVVIGSGDREDPLDQGGDVDNWFYAIKDRNVEIGGTTDSTRNHFDLTDVTNRCIAGSTLTCEIGGDGWRMHLDNPNGEKALSAPVTIDNNIFFTTYLPPSASTNTCGPGEGSGFLYALKLETGAPARNYNTADGGPNPDGSGTTDDDRDMALQTPGIPAQVVYLGTPPGSGGTGGACTVNILAGTQILAAPGCPRFRTFWQRVGQ